MPLFSRRLDRFFPHEDHASRIDKIISLYKVFAKRFAQCLIVSHVEVVLNQWCTSRRFSAEPVECPFLCGFPQDDLSHIITCEVFQHVFHTCMGQRPILIPLANLINLDAGNCSDQALAVFYLLFYIHICHNSFNACRNGHTFDARLVTSKLKLLSLHCGASRASIAKSRQHNFLPSLM